MVLGVFLLTATSTSKHLICLSGLDFRLRQIVCVHCSWGGKAGELRSAGSSHLATAYQSETMTYACPKCSETIAIHQGLSSQEVLQEMQAIREVLAAELSTTLNGYDLNGYEEGAKQEVPQQEVNRLYDFAANLEKIRVALLPEQSSVAKSINPIPPRPEPVKPEHTKPAVRNAENSIVRPKSGRVDLDFAEVRARIAGIA
jgi:hypothetical protein